MAATTATGPRRGCAASRPGVVLAVLALFLLADGVALGTPVSRQINTPRVERQPRRPLLVAQASSRKRRRRRPRRSRRAKPKATPARSPARKKVTPKPAPTPAAAPAAVPRPSGLQRGARVEFDGRLVQGQTAKSGAIYLFARQRSPLRSMVEERASFRTEILKSVYPDWKAPK